MNEAEAETAEMQTWLEFFENGDYLGERTKANHYKKYDNIIGKLVNMIDKPKPWILEGSR